MSTSNTLPYKSASMFAMKALHIPKLNENALKAENECNCKFCGAFMEEGESAFILNGSSAFVDQPYQYSTIEKYACIACNSFFKASWLRATAAMSGFARLIISSGMFNLNKNIHRAWFLRNLPDEPFIFMVSTSKNQHLIWKAVVNYSKEAFYVQLGNQQLLMKPRRVESAFKLIQKHMPDINQILSDKHNKKVVFRDPFVSLDRNIEDLDFGQFRLSMKETFQGTSIFDELYSFLAALNTIELWALGILLSVPEGSEERPEHMNLSEIISKIN